MKEILKKIPFVARNGRKLINYIQFVRNKKGYDVKVRHPFEMLNIEGYDNVFWGYYDKSPFNPNNDELLLLLANNHYSSKLPSENVGTDICLYNNKTKELEVVDTTYSWNWQQGCRQQWISSEELIYNNYDRINKRFISIKYNILNKSKIIYDFPVQDAYSNKYFISIDYEALNRIRPDYGYRNIVKNHNRNVVKIDIRTGVSEEIIIIDSLIKRYIGDFSQESISAKINHIMISPNGLQFVFLLRFVCNKVRKHILFLYDIEKEEEKLIISGDNIISHYTWIDDSKLFFWGEINHVSDYYTVNVKSLKIKESCLKLPDGHPFYIKDKKILTDTYPNKSRLRKLLILNQEKNSIDEIAEFLEPTRYVGETRCDLHPSMNLDRNKISVDTVYKKRRLLCIIDLKERKL